MTSILTITNLNKRFKHQQVISDLSMIVKKGDIYGLIGRNGSGKTTTLKLITNLIHADSGEITLFGQTGGSAYTKALLRTSSMIEEPVAFDSLSASQNLHYYCKLRGIVNRDQVIKDTLRMVGLENVGKKAYKHFSLGMKQKLGLAIALLSKPDLVMLDEPLNGLDPIAIIELRQLITKLNQELGITFIISSHILSELFLVATTFGFIKDGTMVQELSKEAFNQINRRFIVIETQEVSDVTVELDRLGLGQYKVVDKQTLHLFDNSYSVQDLAKFLLDKHLAFDGLFYSRTDLESYFNDMVGTDSQGGAR